MAVRAIDKKNPAKIGRELIIRVHLLIYSPVTPHLFPENLGNLPEFTAVRAIDKKKPGQNWSGVN
jgi:hypothetical protein